MVRRNRDHRGNRSRAGWMVHIETYFRGGFVFFINIPHRADRAAYSGSAGASRKARQEIRAGDLTGTGGLLAAVGLGGIVFELNRIDAGNGRRFESVVLVIAPVLGGEITIDMMIHAPFVRFRALSAEPTCSPFFYTQPLSQEFSSLFPARSDSGARLFPDGSPGRRCLPLHSADVSCFHAGGPADLSDRYGAMELPLVVGLIAAAGFAFIRETSLSANSCWTTFFPAHPDVGAGECR